MSISKSRYVLITSGVGGSAVVARRELIARLMTTNELVATNGVLEFGGGSATALKNIGNYFGTTSPEYAFAKKYFSFVSKDIHQPEKMSFARYSLTATAPQLISTEVGKLADLKAITTGSLKLSMGGSSYEITGLDFSSATSYADCATVLQTAVNGNTTGGDLWTDATVSFTNGAFVLTGGDTGANEIVPATSASSGTDVSGLLGWSSANNPVVSVGTDGETITQALDRIVNESDNFGSFDFVESLTTEQIGQVAEWTHNQNVAYVFSHAVNSSNYQSVQEVCAGKNGVCLTLGNDENAEYMPMAIGACIDYSKVGASTNFMFTQFAGETPTVKTDDMADRYDSLKINYLGTTQQAGKTISFYQRGFLQGDVADIGVYWNEMWLKDAIASEMLNLLLAVKQLPANEDGSSTARGILMNVIDEAKTNGVILSGKTFDNTQKAYITSLTGDNEAWREVELNGFWLDVNVESYINSLNGLTEYKFEYTLIYGKGDSIRKITGSDILI